MAAEQRKLLEQLMGESAMSGSTVTSQRYSITDPKVCRSYLVGTCPHDLFTNTKNDLGTCPKVHNEALKAEYDNAAPEQKAKWAFDYDYMRDMQKYIDECNRKIDAAQRRLEKTADEVRQTNALLRELGDLGQTISTGLREVEVLCELGAVNIAVMEHFRLRATQQTRAERERELKALSDTGGPSGHQKLQVCDVCGAYLSRLDNDRRLADHFYGKMHLGYAQMRKTWEVLAKEYQGKPPPIREDFGAANGGDRGGYGDGGGWGGRGGGFGGRGGGFRGRGRGRGGYGGGQRW